MSEDKTKEDNKKQADKDKPSKNKYGKATGIICAGTLVG